MIKSLLGSVALMVATASVAAAADTGWYLGASVGRADIRNVCTSAADVGLAERCDEKSIGWKVFGGYNFTNYLGLEWGYVNLGEAKVDAPAASGTATSKSWAAPVVAVVSMPIGERFDLFVKGGAYYFKNENKASGSLVGVAPTKNDDGIEQMYGIGASVKVWQRISVRLEYEHYNDVGNGKADTVTAGLQLHF